MCKYEYNISNSDITKFKDIENWGKSLKSILFLLYVIKRSLHCSSSGRISLFCVFFHMILVSLTFLPFGLPVENIEVVSVILSCLAIPSNLALAANIV